MVRGGGGGRESVQNGAPSLSHPPFHSSDVPLPDGVDPPVEPDAGDVGGGDTGPAEEDRWTELGLGELNVS